jgi:hypothetical protein
MPGFRSAGDSGDSDSRFRFRGHNSDASAAAAGAEKRKKIELGTVPPDLEALEEDAPKRHGVSQLRRYTAP